MAWITHQMWPVHVLFSFFFLIPGELMVLIEYDLFIFLRELYAMIPGYLKVGNLSCCIVSDASLFV